jgi:hypothetical protein
MEAVQATETGKVGVCRQGGDWGVCMSRQAARRRTPNTRNTFLAAATDAWIFFALPGSPAEMNMQVYCRRQGSSSQCEGATNWEAFESSLKPLPHLYERCQLVFAACLCQEAVEGLRCSITCSEPRLCALACYIGQGGDCSSDDGAAEHLQLGCIGRHLDSSQPSPLHLLAVLLRKLSQRSLVFQSGSAPSPAILATDFPSVSSLTEASPCLQ